jgi:hypothetical protein
MVFFFGFFALMKDFEWWYLITCEFAFQKLIFGLAEMILVVVVIKRHIRNIIKFRVENSEIAFYPGGYLFFHLSSRGCFTI